MMLAGKKCNCNLVYPNITKRFRQECLCSILPEQNKKSVMSELYGAHSIGKGIFQFLTVNDANNLRETCRELNYTTSKYYWSDNVEFDDMTKFYKFHTCYPNALNITLNDGEIPIYNKLHGSHKFNIYKLSKFNPPKFLDSKKIKNNFMMKIIIYNREQFDDMIKNCKSYMKHIHVQIRPIDSNSNNEFNDNDFTKLSKITHLNISYQDNITDRIFQYLSNLEYLDMTWGDNYISGKGFKYLTNLKELCIDECLPRIHRNALKYCSNAKIIYNVIDRHDIIDGDSDEDIDEDI